MNLVASPLFLTVNTCSNLLSHKRMLLFKSRNCQSLLVSIHSTLSSATSLWDHMRSERAGAASHCEFGVQQSQTQKNERSATVAREKTKFGEFRNSIDLLFE